MQIPVHYTPEQLDYTRRVLGQRPHDEVRPVIVTIEQAVAAFSAQQKAQQPTMPKRGRKAKDKGPLVGPQIAPNGAQHAG